MEASDIVANGVSAIGHDLTLWGMFWQADLVVKSVMLGLVAASVWCWGIIIDKSFLYARTQRAMDRFEDVFWSGQSLDDLYATLRDRNNHDMAAVFMAAMGEWKRSVQATGATFVNLTQRIDKVLDVTIQREVGRLESKLLVLATIGSASPFVGLFGTVWGIMTSFRGIAASKNTSLAVVAPGIAEALFATAIGLFAAIPAVIAYNWLQARAGKQQARLEGFADEFSAIISRQIDQRIAG
jgi:biopolymer transport protein TolQ